MGVIVNSCPVCNAAVLSGAWTIADRMADVQNARRSNLAVPYDLNTRSRRVHIVPRFRSHCLKGPPGIQPALRNCGRETGLRRRQNISASSGPDRAWAMLR
jgi:hypothetical protein